MKIEKFQYISQESQLYNHIEGIIEACKCGVKWVQLRLKEGTFAEKLAIANQAKLICTDFNATLIINDDPALAKASNANGVHLGKNDMPIKDARIILGNNMIIGGTANTFQDIQHLCFQGVNYIGLGPFAYTSTKINLSPILGLEGYSNILNLCKSYNINIPIVAIGGITLTPIKPLLQTGIYGIAVSGLLANSNNMQIVFNQIQTLLKE